MTKHREIKAKGGGHELTVQDHETDTPILPINQLERLHNFRPDRVDWVFEQTEIEAKTRREQAALINDRIFKERMAGLVFAFTLGLVGLCGAVWLASMGREAAAASIGGITLASLVSAFIYSKKQ
jgi:hypothetical protein